ncbi:hypothetical protein [Bartonella sp. DGB2]|uniref:hypothetical protein n=1 Tax=Bartonella sp. DGB2 TaxID=3388426 RepID=UPI0039901A41
MPQIHYKSCRILVFDAGDAAGIDFYQALKLCGKKYHVIAADANPYRLKMCLGDDKFLLPDIREDNENFLNAVQKILKKTEPDFIYAADTGPILDWLVTNQDSELFKGKVFLSPSEAMEVYENKWLSYHFMKRADVVLPETILISYRDELKKFLKKHGNIWLRATHGSGGVGSLPTASYEMACAWIDHANGWGRFTAAEVLTKKMATWIGIWANGQLLASQSRARLYWEYASLSPSGVTF